MDHLLLGYLGIQRSKVNWKKLGVFSNATPDSARATFTKDRCSLEKWEKKRTAGMTTKKAERAEDGNNSKTMRGL
ncbi:uncharacterized protein N7479_004238 [Penicillium vulpinum]|uniref:uncharacterized protein n=1 Tax=Penicillium vulpinum TaxID=29845 RepID=UPI002547A91D|nr:uncharacterized protein N7479_004238 [Penicillium vulpinum]KAJ5964362.1 hypothetical protein N7479_004238 [Penicillium vulpinum]